MEVWKDVVGYEGLYQVSNIGNVRSPSGDSAYAPGLFSDPTENINCRCVCELVRG